MANYGTKWGLGNQEAFGGKYHVIEPNTPDGCLRLYDDISPTINTMTGGQRQPCVIQQNTRDEVRVVGDGKIAGALPAQPGMKQQNYVVFDWQSGGDVRLNVSNKHTSALQASQTPAVLTNAVRRLTPTECERLQSFPDGFTDGQSDTQRYKQLGNAVTVNVAEWIGRRIMDLST